jgi:hypothetical protein
MEHMIEWVLGNSGMNQMVKAQMLVSMFLLIRHGYRE